MICNGLNWSIAVRSGFFMPEKKSRPVPVPVQQSLGKKPDRTGLSSTRFITVASFEYCFSDMSLFWPKVLGLGLPPAPPVLVTPIEVLSAHTCQHKMSVRNDWRRYHIILSHLTLSYLILSCWYPSFPTYLHSTLHFLLSPSVFTLYISTIPTYYLYRKDCRDILMVNYQSLVQNHSHSPLRQLFNLSIPLFTLLPLHLTNGPFVTHLREAILRWTVLMSPV